MSIHKPVNLLQVYEEKKRASDAKLDERIKSARRSIQNNKELVHKLQAIKEGTAASLERYANETDQERCEREYKARIREYLREVRQIITGSRLKNEARQNLGYRIFEFLYHKFRKRFRPVHVSMEMLSRLFGPARTVYRRLDSLRKLGYINWYARRGKGKGNGRASRAYVILGFPDWHRFKAEFVATYGPLQPANNTPYNLPPTTRQSPKPVAGCKDPQTDN